MEFKHLLAELGRYSLVDADIDEAGNVNSVTIGIAGDPTTYSKLSKEETEELEDIMTNLNAGVMDFNIFPNKYAKITPAERDSAVEGTFLDLDSGLYEKIHIIRPQIDVKDEIASAQLE